MSQGGTRLRCRTGLSPAHAPRALFQVAAPVAASLLAHAALVAGFPGRSAAAESVEPPADWVEAPEPVNLESPAPADGEEGSEATASPGAPTSQGPPSDAPQDHVDLPPADAVPGAHAGKPMDARQRAAWWAAAKKVAVGVDSTDTYDALRAQMAGWSPKLIGGSYTPGRTRIAHPEELPSQRVPTSAIASVLQSNASRFRVCHGAGLPQSATVSGQVVVEFTIELDGHVSGARDAGGTFPDDAVRRCVVRAVGQLSFSKPPTGAPQQVTVPVALEAEAAMARPGLEP